MFATFTTATASAIASKETLITDLEQQLQTARQELAQFQQQQQAEQTAKSAAETALEMVRKARKLVEVAYGSAALQEFDRALVEDEAAVGELPQADRDDSDAGPEPTPITPTPTAETDAPVTVVVEAVTVADNEQEAETQADVGEVGESQNENALDFSKLTWTRLQKLAVRKGLSIRGKKKSDILQAIAHLVTQSDIDQAA